LWSATQEARRALQSWGAWVYGLAFILVLSPLAALAVLQVPLVPREFAVGLAVFCCMPTTLTSGVSLTQVHKCLSRLQTRNKPTQATTELLPGVPSRGYLTVPGRRPLLQAAGGNSALALGMTVSSNLIAIGTMPFALALCLGCGGVHLSPGPLLRSLAQCILAPVLVGQLARRALPPVAAWVAAHKKEVSMLSSSLLILVPWMQVRHQLPHFPLANRCPLAIIS
jgi:sodium/bile acid cotransporter 7